MKTRIANLPVNKLVTTLKGLRTELDALKQPQRTSQASGILGYVTDSGNTWDATATPGSDGDTGNRTTTFTITWTGDGSQDIAFAELAVDLFVNGTDSAHQLTPVSPSWTDGTRNASVSYGGVSISHHTYTETITLTTFKAVTYYLKVTVYGSCLGTIGVTAV